jgi:DNA topoisomerase-3
MARLILSEKPSAGAAYAKTLGATVKKDGYFMTDGSVNPGNDLIITWCVGHLVELANADLYDERYKKWNIADLPIIPEKWKYVVSSDKEKQFKIVKSLMNRADVSEIIFATDAGREGELIARLVYEKAGCTKPIFRAWLSSMEEKAIVEAFENPGNGAEYENLYRSALCRSKADWAVGINGTRIFTKLYNKKLNVGRVQTPTLAMICERDDAISNFVKEKYFNVHLNGTGLLEKIKEQSEAEKIKSECNGNTAIVRSVKREKKSANPPKLYDLTTLQREANRLYGFTAQQTLDYTQSLYEMKLVTYPRTDSRYLTDDMGKTAREIISAVLEKMPCFSGLTYAPDVSKILNSKKVSDHTGLIPTSQISLVSLDSVPDGERKILFLIANKLLCATAGKYEYESVSAEIECAGYVFKSHASTVINDGWKAVDRRFKSGQKVNSDEIDTAEIPLDFSEGETLENIICSVTEHYTSPPKHYTEDTLLSAMERAGTDEITEDAERSGLGTPATRASIIEKLIKSGFIKRDGKNIVASGAGKELASIVPDFMKSAKLTAGWENILSLIAKGDYPADDFMGDIKNLVTNIISFAKENVNPKFAVKSDRERIGACPRCGKDVVEYPKSFSCESGKDGCGFTLWKNNKFFESAKKEFTKEIAAALVNNGKCEVSGLYSPKTGKTYNAVVCLDDTGTWVNFKLEFAPKSKRRS